MRKFAAALLCILLSACGEREEQLGAGYTYVQLDGSSYAISDSNNRMVVAPNVSRYKILGSYIVGERKDANIDDRLSKHFSYFILDMQSGALLEGLDQASFKDALEARHLNSKPFSRM